MANFEPSKAGGFIANYDRGLYYHPESPVTVDEINLVARRMRWPALVTKVVLIWAWK